MPPVDFPTGIILASGLSTRMGYCKQLHPLCGKPLIRYVLETLLEAGLTRFVITVNSQTRQPIAALVETLTAENRLREGAFHCDIVFNAEPERGQGFSTGLAVKTARMQNPSGFLFCTADQPFLRPESVAVLCSVFRSNPGRIVSAVFNGKRCSPVAFPVSLAGELCVLDGTIGGRAVMDVHRGLVMLSPLQEEMEMFDIDTPADFRRGENYLKGYMDYGASSASHGGDCHVLR